MEDMYKLKEMLCRELEEFSRRDSIESYDLDTIHKLTDTIKNIDKIEMLEEGGYSQARGGGGGRGGGRGGGGYSREGGGGYSQEGGGSSYAGGSSYGDGGYSGEDSFGDGGGYSQARRRRDERGRYSRDDGRDHMVNQLESMMGRVSSEQDRETLRRMIDQMKGA